MRLIFTAITLGLSLLVASGWAVAAQDFENGLAAIKSGDYVTALLELRPLAVKGSAQAQSEIGKM